MRQIAAQPSFLPTAATAVHVLPKPAAARRIADTTHHPLRAYSTSVPSRVVPSLRPEVRRRRGRTDPPPSARVQLPPERLPSKARRSSCCWFRHGTIIACFPLQVPRGAAAPPCTPPKVSRGRGFTAGLPPTATAATPRRLPPHSHSQRPFALLLDTSRRPLLCVFHLRCHVVPLLGPR